MLLLTAGDATGYAHRALVGSPGPARLLGSFPTACYLRLGSGAVIAVLRPDAVRLPIGITVALDRDLRTLTDGPIDVRADRLAVGRLRVAVRPGPDAALGYCGRPVGPLPELPALDLPALDPFEAGAVPALLGRGPGLTPAGDDLLAGALAGGVLFGLDAGPLAAAVLDRLASGPAVTTDLSRQLLLAAVAGDGLPELHRVGRSWCLPDPAERAAAWRALLAIGHSSGAALGAGLLAAARRARRCRAAA